MITISNLSVQFGGNFLFENFSTAIKEKDKVGLVGRNGNGKSTLLKIIAGVMKPETGNISFPNRYKVGYLPQEFNFLSEKTVFDEAAEALQEIKRLERRIEEITNELGIRTDYESDDYFNLINELTEANERFDMIGGGAAEAQVEQVLIGLGFLRKEFDKKMSEFSGGWQMRVELAKILLSNPDCILLDEPTNHLDIESVRWLEEFLRDYQGSIMLVSHDSRFLDNITNRTIELTRGRIYDAPLPYTQFQDYRFDLAQQQQATRNNQEKQIAQMERFVERFKAKASFASRARSKMKAIDRIDLVEIDEFDDSSMRFKFPEPPRSGRVLAEAHNIIKSYDGRKVVLQGIDFALERGDRVAFVGKNGEGKSTFSKILAGITDYEGKLELGHNVYMGYFAQHQADLLNGDETVFEVIDNAAKDEMRPRVRALLGAFLFSGDNVYKKVRVLSGGEKSRLALAKLLLEPVNLLIMDEPTNHLDMVAKEVLKSALSEFSGALVMVSHDRDFLQGLTNKTLEFKQGKIKEYPGDIEEFLRDQQLSYLDELEANRAFKKEAKAEEKSKQTDDKKEKNKLQKELSALESEINAIGSKISALEKEFSNADFYANTARRTVAEKEYNELKAQNEVLTEKWSLAVEELEKM